MLFSESKVTEMAAYLLHKRGGQMSYLKLMKLLYLADRESLNRYSIPISYDRMVSMPKGPVLSGTYALINTGGLSPSSRWSSMIRGAANWEVALARDFDPDSDLEDLSSAEVDVLDAIWSDFGHMTRFELVDYTHEHCPEWQDPNGSSYPITPESVFVALGKSSELADEAASVINSRRQLGQFLSSLK